MTMSPRELAELELPDCPGCDTVRSLRAIAERPGWFECSCCCWRVRIVAGVILETRPR